MEQKEFYFEMFVNPGKIRMCEYAFDKCEGALNKKMCFSYCVNNGLDFETGIACIKQELKDQKKIMANSIKKHEERFY